MELVGPVELRYIGETSDPRDAGYSGIAINATSHCSLHAWPPYQSLVLAYQRRYFPTDERDKE
jgi:S-adenosylmethionine/arginine decarboxylase-like enzyme